MLRLFLFGLNAAGVHGRILRHDAGRNSFTAGRLCSLCLLLLHVLFNDGADIFPVDPLVNDDLLDGTDNRTCDPVKAHAGRKREAEPCGNKRHCDIHYLHLLLHGILLRITG